jgi:hypothetical protein
MNSNKFWERDRQEMVNLLVQKGLPSVLAKRVKYLLRDGPDHEAWRQVFTHFRYLEIGRTVLARAPVENADAVLELATTRATLETHCLQTDLLRLVGQQ